MPICACKKDNDPSSCIAPMSCEVWDDRHPFCQACRGNRCRELSQLEKLKNKKDKDIGDEQTGKPYDSTASAAGTWIPSLAETAFAEEPKQARQLNLLNVRPPGSWAGFMTYLDTMSSIAMGQAKGSDVLDKLASAEKQQKLAEAKQDNN